jgi:hypothetical protein
MGTANRFIPGESSRNTNSHVPLSWCLSYYKGFPEPCFVFKWNFNPESLLYNPPVNMMRAPSRIRYFIFVLYWNNNIFAARKLC